MTSAQKFQKLYGLSLAGIVLTILSSSILLASEISQTKPGNFGLPGVFDIPTARKFQDGELIITHQNHKNIFMMVYPFKLFRVWD